MNILHTESSLNWGGQELRIIEECQWLISHGHKAYIAVRPDSKIFARAKDSNIPTLSVPFRGTANPKAIKTLKSFCAKNNIDLINTHSTRDSWHAMWLKFTGIPVIRSLHVTDKQKDDLFHKLLWKHGNNGIIATADLIRAQLIELGLAAQKIDVVGEYADPETFHPDISGKVVRSEFGVLDSEVLITNIGMIRPDKGQTTILRTVDSVIAKYPNAKFLFVGEATKPEFQQAFDTERARVKNQGNVIVSGYRKDIPEVMAASDYITISSTSVEGQSKIAPQCFAMKKPVISTDAGALKEMIHGASKVLGILIKPGKPQDLSAAILQCLADGYPYDVNEAYDYFKSTLTIESRMQSTLDIYSQYSGRA